MMPKSRFACPIVGAKFHNGAEIAMRSLPDSAPLLAIRQPQNPHDANAVAVFDASGKQQLGFITRKMAAQIAPLMDAAGITKTTGRYDKAVPQITLWLRCDR